MSVIGNLLNGINTGTAHKLASEGPFAFKNLPNTPVSDKNSTREKDEEFVKVLTDKKYSSEEIIRKNELLEQDTTFKSEAFSLLSSLVKTSNDLLKLEEQYNSELDPAKKEAYKTEITAITNEFNNLIGKGSYKNLSEITQSLANRPFIEAANGGLLKSLNDNSHVVGGNFIQQAARGNLIYFKNLDESLLVLKESSLSAEFKDGKVHISAANGATLEKVAERAESAFDAFLKGSSLGGLSKSIEEFRKLEGIVSSNKDGPLDLAADLRTQVLLDPSKGLAAQAFLSPLIALHRLF